MFSKTGDDITPATVSVVSVSGVEIAAGPAVLALLCIAFVWCSQTSGGPLPYVSFEKGLTGGGFESYFFMALRLRNIHVGRRM